MSFSVGIVGLPNVGKSTLFKALTKKQVKIANFPFTTINPNIGIVALPDERLKTIAEITKPPKITPTTIEFIDIAGLVKGAHKGEGLGNQFLAKIRECDAVLEIVRDFIKEDIEHIEKNIDPKRDIEIVKQELIMKDLETLGKVFSKLEEEKKIGNKEAVRKIEVLKKIKKGLEEKKKIIELSFSDEENLLIKEFQFLTQKPVIYLINIAGEQALKPELKHLALDLKLEEEVSELSEEELKELKLASQLDQLIKACYTVLDLITFYTIVGGKEARAWTIKKGTKCPEAGKCVHSDFEEKFIRAEVINWKSLAESGSWSKAKELGEIKTVGKDYVVQDGDVIEFKI